MHFRSHTPSAFLSFRPAILYLGHQTGQSSSTLCCTLIAFGSIIIMILSVCHRTSEWIGEDPSTKMNHFLSLSPTLFLSLNWLTRGGRRVPDSDDNSDLISVSEQNNQISVQGVGKWIELSVLIGFVRRREQPTQEPESDFVGRREITFARK